MIRDVVTRGFGNGTFSGTIALVVTRGYSIAEDFDSIYGWLEYSLEPSRTHYGVAGQTHFNTSGKLHATADKED